MTDSNLWVILFHHKHGESVFLAFQTNEPTFEQMQTIASQDCYDENDENDSLELCGPYIIPIIEELRSALQWLIDDMSDAEELGGDEDHIYDSVATAVLALHHAGGSVNQHLLDLARKSIEEKPDKATTTNLDQNR